MIRARGRVRRAAVSVAAVLSLALVAALAVSGSVAGAAGTPVPGRTAVVGIEQEPPCLNALLDGCFIDSTHWIAGTTLLGAFRVLPDSTYEPMLVDHVDVEQGPFALTYHLRADAVWSDGTPVSADDLLFTPAVIVNPSNSIQRRGRRARRPGDEVVRRRSRFASARPTQVAVALPRLASQARPRGQRLRHRLADEVVNPSTSQPIASGPVPCHRVDGGQSLTLGATRSGGAPTRRCSRRSRSVHPECEQPVPGDHRRHRRRASRRRRRPDRGPPHPARAGRPVRRGAEPEPHRLQHQSSTMPLIGEQWFRQASRMRSTATRLPAPVRRHQPRPRHAAEPRPSRRARPLSARLRPVATARRRSRRSCRATAACWAATASGHAAASARRSSSRRPRGTQPRLLTAGCGCRDGSGRDRASFPDNSALRDLLRNGLPAGPLRDGVLFGAGRRGARRWRPWSGCGGASNWLGYCSTPATDLLAAAQVEVDSAARAELVNDANDVIAEDVPTLPLLLRPMFLAVNERLHGPEVNPFGLATWNVETWQLEHDATAPVTTAVASPIPNAKGWNVGTVTVGLRGRGRRPGSRGDSLQPHRSPDGRWCDRGANGTVTVSGEGITKLVYYAIDGSGTAEPRRKLVVRIDRTAPAVACVADPQRISPPNGRLVRVDVDVSVADDLSGPARRASCSPAPRATNRAPTTSRASSSGRPTAHGQLEAESSPDGDGRVYSLEYSATDRAGNTASCTARVEVPRTP